MLLYMCVQYTQRQREGKECASHFSIKEVNNLSKRSMPLCLISLLQSLIPVSGRLLHFYTDLSPFHIVYLCSLPVWLPPSTLSPSLKPFKSMCSQRTFVKMYSNTAASFITPSACVFSLHSIFLSHQTSPCNLYLFNWIQWSLHSYCLKDFLHQEV